MNPEPCKSLKSDYAANIFPVLPLLYLCIMVIILTARPVNAEIYTYEDENGTVHFSHVPTDPQYKMIIPPKVSKPIPSSLALKGGKDAKQSDFNKLIETKSYKYGIDPALVKAVIAVESDFNPNAVSVKGARGLMQLMPLTANELGVFNSFDPEANIDGGTRYLRYLLDYFSWDVDLALAAYNAGITRVIQHTGIPPIPATHEYIGRVKTNYKKYILQ
ncbi:MAG: lytic transglycosylase domain-containing protein [Nitrospira sp.]|nr:lytic transglycosylase domain-containing protein [Nitrospira sp.]